MKTEYMEVTAAVLYDGSLAHYDVQVLSRGECVARLADYRGNSSNHPPQAIRMRKEGRHWVSDVDNKLSDDLGYAVELKVKPLIEERKRSGGHPAG